MSILFRNLGVFTLGVLASCQSTPTPAPVAASEGRAVEQVKSVSKLEYSPANFHQRKWVKNRFYEAFREQGVNSITADECAKSVTLGLASSPHSLAINSAGGAKISPLFVMEIWSHAASELKVTEAYDPQNAFPPKVTKSYCHRLYGAAAESAHDDITDHLRLK